MIKDTTWVAHSFVYPTSRSLHPPPHPLTSSPFFPSIKFDSQVLCWQDLGVLLPRRFWFNICHAKGKKKKKKNRRKQQQQHAFRFAWSLAVGERGHLSLQGRLDVRTQWGHEDTPALHRLGGEDTAWIHKWMIHFLSSSSTFFPITPPLPLHCESLRIGRSCSKTVGPSWLLTTRSPSLSLPPVFSPTFLTLKLFRGQMGKQNFEPDGTRLQLDAADVALQCATVSH